MFVHVRKRHRFILVGHHQTDIHTASPSRKIAAIIMIRTKGTVSSLFIMIAFLALIIEAQVPDAQKQTLLNIASR